MDFRTIVSFYWKRQVTEAGRGNGVEAVLTTRSTWSSTDGRDVRVTVLAVGSGSSGNTVLNVYARPSGY